MTSFNELYIELQNIYIKKANEDKAQLLDHIKAFVAEKKVAFEFDEDEFVLFIKNLRTLDVF